MLQQVMQNSIPLCKGHREPCVARVVRKRGANFGRRFYVSARAEVLFLFKNSNTAISKHIAPFLPCFSFHYFVCVQFDPLVASPKMKNKIQPKHIQVQLML